MKNNFREARELKRLTQDEVADKLGVARATYGRYENGQRECSFETLNKLADFLGVSTDYLLGRSSTTESVSGTRGILLNIFDCLNPEGQNLVMGMLSSLKMSHSKRKQRSSSVIQKNSGGTNFIAMGGGNNYSTVAP